MKRAVLLMVGIMLMATTVLAANGDLTVDGVVHSGGNHYNVLSYNFNGTPTNGIKIRTNIPFANGVAMPTIIIDGYSYAYKTPFNIMVSWYIYNNNFIQYGAASNTYNPTIMLAKETRSNGDFVVMYIDDRRYFSRFSVSAFAKGMGEQDSWFEGWTASDETLSETSQVTVPYRSPSNFTVASSLSGYKTMLSLDEIGNNGNNAMGVDWRFAESSGFPWGATGRVEVARQGTSASFDMKLHTALNGVMSEKVRILGNGNVGIGMTAPAQKLEVDGGLRLNTNTVKPATCDATTRGTVWLSKGGAGVADKLEVCVKDAAEVYSWRMLF
jgi:hypothetical protein